MIEWQSTRLSWSLSAIGERFALDTGIGVFPLGEGGWRWNRVFSHDYGCNIPTNSGSLLAGRPLSGQPLFCMFALAPAAMRHCHTRPGPHRHRHCACRSHTPKRQSCARVATGSPPQNPHVTPAEKANTRGRDLPKPSPILGSMPVGTRIRPVENGREQRPVDCGFAGRASAGGLLPLRESFDIVGRWEGHIALFNPPICPGSDPRMCLASSRRFPLWYSRGNARG